MATNKNLQSRDGRFVENLRHELHHAKLILIIRPGHEVDVFLAFLREEVFLDHLLQL